MFEALVIVTTMALMVIIISVAMVIFYAIVTAGFELSDRFWRNR